jgi:hypothetical protein
MRQRNEVLCAIASAIIAVAWAVPATLAQQPAKPAAPATAPAKRLVYTYRDYHRESLEFNRQTTVEAYRKVGKHSPQWDDKAIAYLDHMAQQFAVARLPSFYRPEQEFTRDSSLPLGEALVKAGCDDPLVLYCHGAMLNDVNRREEALPILRRALEGLRERKYPWLRIAVAERRLARLVREPEEVSVFQKGATQAWVEALCGKHSDIARRSLVHTCWSSLAKRDEQKALIDALAARPDADPWMKNVLAGRFHIDLAWDSRGGGWANTVTDEGWKGFHANLALARDAFTAAWKIAPNLPEPMADMITVAMGAGDGLNEKPMDWFERTLEAQIDFDEAYTKMIGGPLLPRWGGSYEEMMQLADACVVRPRFDTNVPWYYVVIVKQIGIDSERPWVLLAQPKVYDNLVRVMEGYAVAFGKKKGAHYKMMHAAAAWRVGKLAEARKIIEELEAAGFGSDQGAWLYFNAESGPEAVGSVYAHTGPHAKAIADAEKLNKDGDANAATTAFKAVLEKLPAKDPAAAYISRRVIKIDAAAKFAAGEWSPLQTSAALSGWRTIAGRWTLDADGSPVGQCDPNKPESLWALLRWLGKENGRDPGKKFEVAGTLDFKPRADDPIDLNGGLMVYPQVNSGTPGVFVGVNKKAQQAFFRGGAAPVKVDVEFKDGSEFCVRFDDRTVTLFIDGKQVGEPYAVPENWKGNLTFALATHGSTPTWFRNMRIRKLP